MSSYSWASLSLPYQPSAGKVYQDYIKLQGFKLGLPETLRAIQLSSRPLSQIEMQQHLNMQHQLDEWTCHQRIKEDDSKQNYEPSSSPGPVSARQLKSSETKKIIFSDYKIDLKQSPSRSPSIKEAALTEAAPDNMLTSVTQKLKVEPNESEVGMSSFASHSGLALSPNTPNFQEFAKFSLVPFKEEQRCRMSVQRTIRKRRECRRSVSLQAVDFPRNAKIETRITIAARAFARDKERRERKDCLLAKAFEVPFEVAQEEMLAVPKAPIPVKGNVRFYDAVNKLRDWQRRMFDNMMVESADESESLLNFQCLSNKRNARKIASSIRARRFLAVHMRPLTSASSCVVPYRLLIFMI